MAIAHWVGVFIATKGLTMQEASSPPVEKLLFTSLKGLALVAEVAVVLAVAYAASMAARYWPSIGV
jgi:hypothetical protein